jgi:hypothetical protein
MNKFKLYFFVFATLTVLFSCNKADSPEIIPPRDYQVQYDTEIEIIRNYLKTYYIDSTSVNANPEDIKLTKILAGSGNISLWDSPRLDSIMPKPKYDGVEYTVYYIKIRKGSVSGIKPVKVDQVLAAYKGAYLNDESTVDIPKNIRSTEFEYIPYPENFIFLNQTIRGWQEIIPLFKSGQIINASGSDPVNYTDFGAGVMFLPSGLAYYNAGSGSIPSYSPLVFTFKLYDVRRADQDGDGILSIDESNDGSDFTKDTDGDGSPDYLDIDDDGDGYFTKTETKYTDSAGAVHYYPYNGAAFDDPTTLIDETKGVPSCGSDFTTPTRLRRYLDPSCH